MAVQNSHHSKTTGVSTNYIIIMPGSKIVTLLAAQRGGQGFPFHLSLEAWAVLELDRGGLSSLTSPECIPRSYRRAIEVRILLQVGERRAVAVPFQAGCSGWSTFEPFGGCCGQREGALLHPYICSLTRWRAGAAAAWLNPAHAMTGTRHNRP